MSEKEVTMPPAEIGASNGAIAGAANRVVAARCARAAGNVILAMTCD